MASLYLFLDFLTIKKFSFKLLLIVLLLSKVVFTRKRILNKCVLNGEEIRMRPFKISVAIFVTFAEKRGIFDWYFLQYKYYMWPVLSRKTCSILLNLLVYVRGLLNILYDINLKIVISNRAREWRAIRGKVCGSPDVVAVSLYPPSTLHHSSQN